MKSPLSIFNELLDANETPRPINVVDKKVFGGDTDINQLSPMKYPWAYDFFKNGISNNWTPEEVPMGQDIADYKHRLMEEERHLFVNVLAYLTTSDIMVARNIAIAIFEKVKVPELQLYLGRQIFEEGLHQHSYQHCIETLNLDQGEVYNRYRTVPEIHQKLILAQSYTDLLTGDLDMGSEEGQREFLKGLVFYGLGFEGVWFYNGFTPVFSLQRRGLMKGTGEQFQYIMRDEAMHAAFYAQLINTIKHEYPHLWGADMEREVVEIFRDVVEAEEIYAGYILHEPLLGYDKETHIGQAKWMVNIRANRIGLPPVYPEINRPPVPWLDEQINLRKEKNFFETRVTEYKSAGVLDW